jgi:hypothetical protein
MFLAFFCYAIGQKYSGKAMQWLYNLQYLEIAKIKNYPQSTNESRVKKSHNICWQEFPKSKDKKREKGYCQSDLFFPCQNKCPVL